MHRSPARAAPQAAGTFEKGINLLFQPVQIFLEVLHAEDEACMVGAGMLTTHLLAQDGQPAISRSGMEVLCTHSQQKNAARSVPIWMITSIRSQFMMSLHLLQGDQI